MESFLSCSSVPAKRVLLTLLGVLLFSTTMSVDCRPGAEGKRKVHHFVFFGRDRERIKREGFLNTGSFEGAQLTYAWKELENDEDKYDFSEIEKDLEFLSSRGKDLFIQLQDTTFNPKRAAVPRYLCNKRKYDGGVVYQYSDDGRPEGLVAMRWHPSVQRRFHKLLCELGKKFDGKIAGINLQETSIGVRAEGPRAARGFTYGGYRDSIQKNMSVLRKAFPRSVTMQYANFMPGEWLPFEDQGYLRSIFLHGEKIGVAVGAPDLMPKKKNQRNHAYRLMHEMKNKMTLGIAVQHGNYSGTTGDDVKPTKPWRNIVRELKSYATNYLGVDYIFWCDQEPYFSHDLVPFFKNDRVGFNLSSCSGT